MVLPELGNHYIEGAQGTPQSLDIGAGTRVSRGFPSCGKELRSWQMKAKGSAKKKTSTRIKRNGDLLISGA